MPKLIIDDCEIEVEAGTKVIEAAARLDIWIPRFCYHPALGSVGACRVCAVKFIQGPFKGVQMSCMIDAQDDMVVSTTDEEAVEFRRHVIEWLMLHHPHDCPVCDEGGHCLLQDMTVSGGHGMRRYSGNKRTYTDQYLGPLLQHEMNRCIHCYRCSRFYQEFSGFRDLGAMQSANKTYFGRYQDGVLESPFCGNLSDICPTGVYTDKPSRFFGRRWDYQRSPSICINCSLGCNTVASAKYRQVKRQEARLSEAVNGHFICDRGRYGFFYSSLESRPRKAIIDGRESEFDQAQRTLKDQLAKIEKNADSGAIAAASSSRGSLETLVALKQLCRLNGWNGPAFFADPLQTQQVKAAIARLEPQLKISLRDVERADFILVVGADPIHEAPMLAMAMRQAKRNGAGVVVLDPRPIALPFAYQHVPVRHDALCVYLGHLIKGVVDCGQANVSGERVVGFFDTLPDDGVLIDSQLQLSDQVLQQLRQSRRPVMVCNTDMVSASTIGVAADFALLLQASEKQAGVFYLMPGANAFAGGMLSEDHFSFLQIIENIENGSTRALILAEVDPFWHFPDRQRLERALEKLDLLVVFDYLKSSAVDKAHIFFPTTTIFETGGTFINQEGRVQTASRVFSGGIPITQTGGGNHPPRIYDGGLPGAQPRAAWRVLLELTGRIISESVEDAAENLWEMLIHTIPELADDASSGHLPQEGVRLKLAERVDLRFSVDWSSEINNYKSQNHAFDLLLVDRTFGTEELSSLSPCLRELARKPCLVMHSDQAETMGLRDGDLLEIDTKIARLGVELCSAENMSPGTLVMPRHRALEWQVFGSGKIRIRKEQIRKKT